MKIAEDSQFTPSRQKVTRILERYNLKLDTYSETSTGIENVTLIADTDEGKFVIRIYRQQKKNTAEIYRELDFMEYLRANNIKVPTIIANHESGRLTMEQFDNSTWQIIVMKFVQGHHAKTYTDELIAELSSVQADIHNLSAAYTGHYATGGPLTHLKESYFIGQIPAKAIVDDSLRDFLERAKAYELDLPQELPHGLCHLDYDTDNVLVNNNSIAAILDFDDVAPAPFIVCLGYTLWHVYAHAGKEASKKYLENYEAQRQLSDLERRYIKPVMLFRNYVISAVKILNGHTSPEEVAVFLKQEAELG